MTDEEDDDPRLRSLRAVWLSLPDEEPPQRGLAELMAAARAKAEEMRDSTQPSLWRRVLAALRGPPALALATVTVLAAGAVVVGRHRDQLETSPRSERLRDEAPAGATAGSASTAPVRPAEGAGAGAAGTEDGFGAPPPGVATGETQAEPPAQAGGALPRAQGAASTEVSRDRSTSAGDGNRDPRPKRRQATHAAPTPTSGGLVNGAPARPAREADKSETLELAIPAENVEAEERPGRFAPPPPAPPAKPSAAPRGGDAAGAPAPVVSDPAADTADEDVPPAPASVRPPPPPSVSTLIARCRAAAARGDCATTRTLAKQIQARDVSAYRARVAKDPQIARCLAP